MLDDLTDAQKFALTALLEVQPASTIGDFVSETDEGDYVTSYRFATTMPGYPGWNWTVTVADLPDEHPTIVESELLPAEGALLAPDWIPWSERMDDYRAAQLALGEAAAELAGLDDDELADLDDDDDDDDDDSDDVDDLFGDNLHSGDLDGVDIDELDDDVDDDEVDELELIEVVMVDNEVVEVDVIEVELGSLDLDVDQPDNPKAKRNSRSKNPPGVAGGRKRAGKEQKND
jgi:hypothetical protein